MAVVEIRCPRCGSPSSLKDEKTHEYQCNHCGTIFRFLDTTKKELIKDIRRHNCPRCGRPVKIGEGYVCKECGKEDLCQNCVEEVADEFICKECVEKKGWNCGICSNMATVTCEVCGKKRCSKHADDFDFLPYDPVSQKYDAYMSWYCPICRGSICEECKVEKRGFFGGKPQYYCKKCGNKLQIHPPKSNYHHKLGMQGIRRSIEELRGES